jgi:ABC-2 type transport system ATP-binding protein
MSELAVEVSHVFKDFSKSGSSSTLKSFFTGNVSSKNQNTKHKQQHVLKDISFTINKGEFFGIVGKNGSGKSTILKIIAQIYQPTKGSVKVHGKLVPFIELGVGFNPELTGRDNVYLNGAILGFSKKEVDAMYDQIVDFAELSDFMDKKLKNYSSGMQVRLAFSMAIRSRADILLVDEVLAVGDADFQRKCFEYFRRLKKEKKTVIFVSHDMDAVSEYCDRALLIKDGSVDFVGSATKTGDLYRKMFGASSDSRGDVASADKRWGTEVVAYSQIKLHETKGSHNKYTLELEIEANEAVEDLVAGFSISNESGLLLFGTNTMIEGRGRLGLEKKQSLELSWSFPDVFQTGNYFVNVALIKGMGEVTYDWWDEAVKFSVKKNRTTPYILSPRIELDVSDGPQ